jgi:hypothetical protein
MTASRPAFLCLRLFVVPQIRGRICENLYLVKGDLDVAIKDVQKAGGRLLERGEHSPGIPYASVTDPDGYVIEL